MYARFGKLGGRNRVLLYSFGALLLFAALWSSAWFLAAAWLGGKAERAFAGAASRGIVVLCPGQRTRGFPAALWFTCDNITVRGADFRAEVGGLRSGASLARPDTVRADVQGPATFESVMGTGRADWAAANVRSRIGWAGLDRVSGHAEMVRLQVPEVSATVGALDASLAAAPGGSRLDLTLSSLQTLGDNEVVPAMGGSFTALLSRPVLSVLRGRFGAGAKASDIRFSMQAGALRLSASGDLLVDSDHLLNGSIAVRVAGIETLPSILATLPPRVQSAGNAVAGALMAIGQPATLEGQPAREVVLQIVRGELRFGFVALGRIPRF